MNDFTLVRKNLFRRKLLAKKPRQLAVLDAAAAKAEWNSALPPGMFRGIAIHDSQNSICAQVVEASVDGFLLAERDLEIRGAGEVFGERQSGFSDLKLGRVPRDEAVVLEARRIAERILDDDPGLARHAALREEVEDLLGDDVDFLFKS